MSNEPHSLSAEFSRPLAETLFAIILGVCFLLFAIGVYWAVLLGRHNHMQRYTEEQAWLRAAQMSRAVSVQAGTMLSGLDYMLRGMAKDYESGDMVSFRRAVASAQKSYPQGAIVQVAVANAQGLEVYSSLDVSAPFAPEISVFDREYFQAHLNAAVHGLFVGHPVQGRPSEHWGIQLSQALHRNGKFAGVLVLSLSPEYISGQLQTIFDNPRDVILLLREDGWYLARSQRQSDVLGRGVPPEQLALLAPDALHGTYEALDVVDASPRMHAWTRVSGFPLLVNVGLDSQAVYGPLQESIQDSLLRNRVGTVLVLLGGGLAAWLAIQRWRAEELRVRGEQRFMRLAQQVPGGLFQYSLDEEGLHVFPFTNPGFYALHCLGGAEAGSGVSGLARCVHENDIGALRASIAEAVRTQSNWEHKYRIACPDGTVRWLHGHAKPHREQDGAVLWHGYILDVTSDEALQEALRQSEERLRQTFDAVRDGLWQWDCVSNRVLWDAQCYDMLDWSDQSSEAFSWAEFVGRLHPQDQQRVQSRLERHLERGEPFRVEMRLRKADGSWCWVESRGEVTQRNHAGQPLRMLGTHTDIHERVEQARLVNALLDRGSALVLVANPAREIVYVNERAAMCFGIAPGRAQPPPSFRALHSSDDSFQAFAELYRLLKVEGTVRTEWAWRVGDGRLRWFDMQGALLDPEDPDGNVIWTLFDVDARHQAEAELAQTQQRMEAIIERFPSGLLVTDHMGQHIVAANQMFVTMMQLPFAPQALIGKPMQVLMPHLQAPMAQGLRAFSQAMTQGGMVPAAPGGVRAVYALPDGRHLEIEPLLLRKDAHLLGLCWVFHDVTTYKQRESQLETLASTDALTGTFNRRAFIERMKQAFGLLSQGRGSPSALIMLDIDHFKRVNDIYGHAIGDEVLKRLVATVSKELRNGDVLGRLGGEEFAVLLSGVSEQAALRRAEDLRTVVERQIVAANGLASIRFTVSLGVCMMGPEDSSIDCCLERADAAMYYSKRHGRNRSTCWRPGIPHATDMPR